MVKIDLTSMVFQHLTVLNHYGIKKGRAHWLCQCSCGNRLDVRGSALTSGNTTSCGCQIRVRMAAVGRANATHGLSRTAEYGAWANMLRRCYDKKNNRFHCYGARGIKVCSRWRYSFENFLADMGIKPTPQHTIDRRNTNGNYTPLNCRWLINSEQSKNRRPPSEWRKRA